MSPPLTCLGCNAQKKGTSKFYHVPDETLKCINKLRENTSRSPNKRVKLDPITEIPTEARICQSCYYACKRIKDTIVPILSDNTPDKKWRKGTKSPHYCAFGCKRLNQRLMRIPKKCRNELLSEYHFYVQEGAEMCSHHLGEASWWKYVKQRDFKGNNGIPIEEFLSIADQLMEIVQGLKSGKNTAILDFDHFDDIDDQDFKDWIGYTKPEFQQISQMAPTSRPIEVAVLLAKFRHSISNRLLANVFGVSKSTIGAHMQSARQDLYENLVPAYLNYSNRKELVSHNTQMAKDLYDMPDNSVCMIWDATYRYIQKSANYEAQRKLYSMQKQLPLYKIMAGVCPDGYIAFALGPYDAKHNDASILEKCFTENQYKDTLKTLKSGDIFLADRGFRDVVEFLEGEENGFTVLTPTMKMDGNQLSTIDANQSRMVTKVRWVVEQAFGSFKKKFKFFAFPGHNGALAHDYELAQIGFALLNMFHQPILSDREYVEVANIMRSRKNKKNQIAPLAKAYNLNMKTACFHKLDSTEAINEIVSIFPQLEMTDLHYLCCGSYQLKNAISYYAQHKRFNDGLFHVSLFDAPFKKKQYPIDYAKYGIVVQESCSD